MSWHELGLREEHAIFLIRTSWYWEGVGPPGNHKGCLCRDAQKEKEDVLSMQDAFSMILSATAT